uniref:glycosyltransferase family 2 protein n=1 Tax=Acetatifactor sp. TaxID=1872090 RepID=UPI004055D717
MNNPKVSVIVPVYNTEKYLRKCLDSLVNQTLKDVEIVVINDGSKDSSPEIIQEYLDAYPDRFVYRSQENSGQAVARNKALSLCNGEYIGFLDSDDFVKIDMFERMYEKAKAEDADYVACGYTDLTYEDGKEIELQHYVASRVALQTTDMYKGALVSPFLHLYRREVMEKSKVKFPERVIYEDTAFYLNLIPHIHKLAVIEEPLAYRVRHSNSTMTTFKAEKVAQIFPVIDAAIAYYKEHHFFDTYKNELEYFCVRVLLCSSMQRIGKVAEKAARKALVNRTLAYIQKEFPEYRKNKLFSGGMQNLYMKSFNKFTAVLYAGMIRIKGKMERQYS